MSSLLGKGKVKHKMRPAVARLALHRIRRELLEIVWRSPDGPMQRRAQYEVESAIHVVSLLYGSDLPAAPITGRACVVLE